MAPRPSTTEPASAARLPRADQTCASPTNQPPEGPTRPADLRAVERRELALPSSPVWHRAARNPLFRNGLRLSNGARRGRWTDDQALTRSFCCHFWTRTGSGVVSAGIQTLSFGEVATFVVPRPSRQRSVRLRELICAETRLSFLTPKPLSVGLARLDTCSKPSQMRAQPGSLLQ